MSRNQHTSASGPQLSDNTAPAQVHVPEHLQTALARVESSFAPVWPLEDYVAVNPFLGMSDQTFMGTRKRLRSVSEAEMLLPLDYYRQRLNAKQLTTEDISASLAEIDSDTFAPRLTLQSILEAVESSDVLSDTNAERMEYTLCQNLDKHTNSNWSEVVRNEVGKHCASHYDKGQAVWANPWKDLSLYQAWRSAAIIDRRMDAIGLSAFRRVVSSLPEQEDAAIAHLLQQLDVPGKPIGKNFFSVPPTPYRGGVHGQDIRVNRPIVKALRVMTSKVCWRFAWHTTLPWPNRPSSKWPGRLWQSCDLCWDE